MKLSTVTFPVQNGMTTATTFTVGSGTPAVTSIDVVPNSVLVKFSDDTSIYTGLVFTGKVLANDNCGFGLI